MLIEQVVLVQLFTPSVLFCRIFVVPDEANFGAERLHEISLHQIAMMLGNEVADHTGGYADYQCVISKADELELSKPRIVNVGGQFRSYVLQAGVPLPGDFFVHMRQEIIRSKMKREYKVHIFF